MFFAKEKRSPDVAKIETRARKRAHRAVFRCPQGLRDKNLANYKLIEVLQGRSSKKPLEFNNASLTTHFSSDYLRTLPDMGPEPTKTGERVLVFSNLYFDSCRVVQAKPSTLLAVRNAIPAPRRSEDELLTGLQ
jgi:hypothetical protein